MPGATPPAVFLPESTFDDILAANGYVTAIQGIEDKSGVHKVICLEKGSQPYRSELLLEAPGATGSAMKVALSQSDFNLVRGATSWDEGAFKTANGDNYQFELRTGARLAAIKL